MNDYEIIGYECKACGFENPLRQEGESRASAKTCQKCKQQKGFYALVKSFKEEQQNE